ncbi:MAG: hypothetical protein JF597_07935 [Streptomyces sp.]|uniref:hypothetical protein n=1 Tax=Streptomyces sp. TaxID=1931 RepID=UPI0025F1F209|nr:hypothetical protein [Streptomyces sp.]MBW8793508.1 hypothetical protein [Streptomyces sp.]
MGDTGGRQQCPPRHEKATPMPRLALYALIVCVLAVVAAVVSFIQGSWLIGVVWVLLTGLSSNMTWYYVRRGRAGKSVTG